MTNEPIPISVVQIGPDFDSGFPDWLSIGITMSNS